MPWIKTDSGPSVGVGLSILSAVVVVWLLYVAVKVAQHVNAWPF